MLTVTMAALVYAAILLTVFYVIARDHGGYARRKVQLYERMLAEETDRPGSTGTTLEDLTDILTGAQAHLTELQDDELAARRADRPPRSRPGRPVKTAIVLPPCTAKIHFLVFLAECVEAVDRLDHLAGPSIASCHDLFI